MEDDSNSACRDVTQSMGKEQVPGQAQVLQGKSSLCSSNFGLRLFRAAALWSENVDLLSSLATQQCFFHVLKPLLQTHIVSAMAASVVIRTPTFSAVKTSAGFAAPDLAFLTEKWHVTHSTLPLWKDSTNWSMSIKFVAMLTRRHRAQCDHHIRAHLFFGRW